MSPTALQGAQQPGKNPSLWFKWHLWIQSRCAPIPFPRVLLDTEASAVPCSRLAVSSRIFFIASQGVFETFGAGEGGFFLCRLLECSVLGRWSSICYSSADSVVAGRSDCPGVLLAPRKYIAGKEAMQAPARSAWALTPRARGCIAFTAST